MSSLANFTVQKKLGEGSFSEVYRVTRKSDGAEYAMKKVKMVKLTSKEKENALNEVRILASVNHPNVIGYKEAFFEDKTNTLCIVMEHADGGDLLQVINQHKKCNTNFTEKQIWHYYVQLVRGLKALHDLKICHRDIKCANVFLTKDGVVKLGDLNVSKVAKRGMLRTQTGTPYYACPEVWKDMPYDFRSDIWSMGCVLYEMITKLPPFRATTMKGLYTKVISGKFEPIGKLYSEDLRSQVARCLKVRSSERPNCNKILAMPGLLNHLTGTLNEIESLKADNEVLMKTIRMPRKLDQITERMPAPQYEVPLKRTNSQPSTKLESLTQTSTTEASAIQLVTKKNTMQLLSPSKKMTPSGRNIELDKKSVSPPSTSEDPALRISKNSQPHKVSQVAGKAVRSPPLELPMIYELAEGKENDTFATGPPLMKVVPVTNKRLEEAHKARMARNVSNESSNSQPRNGPIPRSADPKSNKAVYRLYREPNDASSLGVGQLARVDNKPPLSNQIIKRPPLYRNESARNVQSGVHESDTPSMISHKVKQLRDAGHLVLPRIQSGKPEHSRQQPSTPSALQYKKQVPDYSSDIGGLRDERDKAEPNPYDYLRQIELMINGGKPGPISRQASPSPSVRSVQRRDHQRRDHRNVLVSRPLSLARQGGERIVSSNGHRYISKRSEKSSLNHIQRLRKGAPSVRSLQSERYSRNDESQQSGVQGLALRVPGSKQKANNNDRDSYMQIKREEAAARANLLPRYRHNKQSQPDIRRSQQSSPNLMAPLTPQTRNLVAAHVPSENAMNQYSPLKKERYPTRNESASKVSQSLNMGSRVQSGRAIISASGLDALRQII